MVAGRNTASNREIYNQKIRPMLYRPQNNGADSPGEPVRLEPIKDSPEPVMSDNEDPRLQPQEELLLIEPESEPVPYPFDPDRLRVPNSTNYRCPNCDYILAGLTSRRCPECGEPFTIDDALMHGRESTIGMSELRTHVRRDTIKYWAGVLMLAAAFMGPNIRGGASFPSPPVSFRGWFMLIFMIPLMTFTTYIRQSGDYKWSDMLFIAGLVGLGVGIMLTVT